jgi:MFS family permease
MNNLTANKAEWPLWTRNFTLITIGTTVSKVGNALTGFAMSLLVLDYTHSTVFYALYLFFYMSPRVIMPLLSGPFLDRFSRKRTLYMLDFGASALLLLMAAVLQSGHFHFFIFAVFCFVLGAIDSVYGVAYDSFYPLLISEGNHSKAYSVASTIETVSAIMIPVSAYVYNMVGIKPLFIADAVTFFAAAVMETRIHIQEVYAQKQQKAVGTTLVATYKKDFKEGISYLFGEKGLFAIVIYFTFNSFANGASAVVTLPYFKSVYRNGEYIYMIVWGMSVLGRVMDGAFHYKVKLPAKAKFGIALAAYIMSSLLEGSYLFFPMWAMIVMCFLYGFMDTTSYNIRISATQRYVPDEKKGRYNGTFAMIATTGYIIGELFSGALTSVLPGRMVLAFSMGICAISAVLIIGRNKRVAEMYTM